MDFRIDRKWISGWTGSGSLMDRKWIQGWTGSGSLHDRKSVQGGVDLDPRMDHKWVPVEQEVGSSHTGSGSQIDRKWPVARFIHPVPTPCG